MSRKWIFLVGFVVLLVATTFAILIYLYLSYPEKMFNKVLLEGAHNKYVEMGPLPTGYREGSIREFSSSSVNRDHLEDNWKILHFDNFLIPFPIRHPLYSLVPILDDDKKDNFLSLGMKYYSKNGVLLFSFQTMPPKKLVMDLDDSKIFKISLVKKRILNMPYANLWRDLFLLNLNEVKAATPTDYFYPLFIAKLREENFKKQLSTLSFWPKGEIGIFEMESESNNYTKMEIWLSSSGVIYPLSITYRKYEPVVFSLLERFMDNIKVKLSDKSSALFTYAEYQKITYKDRIDELGMLYLFDAWTHERDREAYLTESIKFLERGTDKMEQLMPFYDYSFRRFGTTFSSGVNLKEKNSEMLKRKIYEELRAEIKNEEGHTVQTTERFESPEAAIEYNLKKGKESGKNRDDDRDLLLKD